MCVRQAGGGGQAQVQLGEDGKFFAAPTNMCNEKVGSSPAEKLLYFFVRFLLFPKELFVSFDKHFAYGIPGGFFSEFLSFCAAQEHIV